MASGDTKTEAMLRILGNGGSADAYRGCCNTKTQSYVLDAIDRVQGLEDEVDALKNNPDVVDIVPTYAALQAYDTSSLGDNDIIRVLADETHNGQSAYYKWNVTSSTWSFIGVVGDYYTKGQVDTLLNGKQNTLTAGSNISISGSTISATDTTYTAGTGIDITSDVVSVDTSTIQPKLTAGSNITIDSNNEISATDTTYSDFTGTDGTAAGVAGLVPAPATTDAGKFLKADGTWGAAGGGVIVGEYAPTSATVADVGQLYLDTTEEELFVCTSKEGNLTNWEYVELKKEAVYGHITYYPNWEQSVDTLYSENAELLSANLSTWNAWAAAHPLEELEAEEGYMFDYNDGTWTWFGMSGMAEIPENEMQATTGLEISVSDTYGSITVISSVTVDESTTETTDVIGEHQWKQLCFTDKNAVVGPFGEDHVYILQDAIKEFIIVFGATDTIPDNFLRNCTRLERFSRNSTDHSVSFPEGAITKVGNNFLRGCCRITGDTVRSQGVDIVELYVGFQHVQEVGDYCMADIKPFDNNGTPTSNFEKLYVTFPKKSVGSNFFSGSTASFVADFSLSSNVAIGDYFFYESGVTSMTSPNNNIRFPRKIPNSFFSGCTNFTGFDNMSLAFEQVEEIGSSFLYGCSSFNSALALPRVKSIGAYFLNRCTVFNSALSIPNLEYVDESFLYSCKAFNQPLTFQYLREINLKYFCGDMEQYVSTITLGNQYIATSGDASYALYCNSSSVPAVTTGITISGAGRQALLSLGNITNHRKLIDGGA